MSPVRARNYSRERELEYLSRTGRAGFVPAGPVRERLQSLRRRGIPLALIAERTGISSSSLIVQLNRVDRRGMEVRSCRMATRTAVMGARFGVEDIRAVPPDGIRRRLQALTVIGYPMPFLAPVIGFDRRELWRLMVGDRSKTFTTRSTLLLVDGLYQRFQLKDPVAEGVDPRMASRTRIISVRKGYAPPHTWDPDTIDDPEAHPEWTGACGTSEGYRIHRREGIPACAACLEFDAAHTPVSLGGLPGFVGVKMRERREARGFSRMRLASMVGVDISSIAYWENGRAAPKQARIPALLSALDATVEDLCMESESV